MTHPPGASGLGLSDVTAPPPPAAPCSNSLHGHQGRMPLRLPRESGNSLSFPDARRSQAGSPGVLIDGGLNFTWLTARPFIGAKSQEVTKPTHPRLPEVHESSFPALVSLL